MDSETDFHAGSVLVFHTRTRPPQYRTFTEMSVINMELDTMLFREVEQA